MSVIVTVTVNRHRVKYNDEHPKDKLPVLCINRYEVKKYLVKQYQDEIRFNLIQVYQNRFGKKVGETEHVDEICAPPGREVSVVSNRGYKTPCGASAWMEWIECESK